MSSLKISNASYSISKKKIFDKLNLAFDSGSTYLWKGNSGSGKSTLARAICGHLALTSGEILLDGTVVTAPQRQLAYLSQHSDLFDWQTLEEHLRFLKDHGIAKDTGSVESHVSALGLTNFLTSYPKQLSVGQMKRVQILRALIMQPKVMILDETLSALDLNLKNKVLSYLKMNWVKNGSIGIIISHELDKDNYVEIDSIVDFNSFSVA